MPWRTSAIAVAVFVDGDQESYRCTCMVENSQHSGLLVLCTYFYLLYIIYRLMYIVNRDNFSTN